MERSRRGKSHSSNFSSHKFQSNPTKSVRPSNSDHHYKNKTTHQQKHRQEEDDYDSFNSLPSLVGTCPHMCPEEERAQRERLRDLAVFERLNGNLGKTSSSLAVKKFCRTISTKHLQASDVRPLPVLEDTLNYLLNLVDSSEFPFEVVHEFIFDRTRSIRQDLSMQNIIDDQAIHMYEKMVKFHVISHHKLRRCSGSSNISPMHHLNMEQLTKALTSLYDLYEANWSSHSIYKNEAEFRSLYVLLHLGSDSQPMGESLSLWFRHVPSRIIKSKEMSFARGLLRYFRLGNYKRFICTTAAEASCLQYCIIEHYINEVRGFAVSCVNHGGYKLHPYPLSDLSKLLMIKESDVESFCNDCGLEISTDELGNKFVPAKQTTFCRPKGGFQNYCLLSSEQFERLFAEGSEFQRL